MKLIKEILFSGEHKSLLILLAMISFIVIIFGKTIFLGMSISKLYLLSQIDSLYNPLLKTTEMRSWYEPTIYLATIPFERLVASILSSGHLPLWNPYNYCGSPLIGEPEYFIFSPFPKIFSVFSPYLYNLGIVFNDICVVIFTYLIARHLGLSRLSSSFSALTYALCPFVVWQLEMHLITWLIPAIVFTVLKLATGNTMRTRILLGVACSLLLVSMHVESFFIGIFIGVLLAISRILIANENTAKEKTTNLVNLVLTLIAGGIICCLLTAPLLFPFAEYLHFGNCYKYERAAIESSSWEPLRVPWQTVLYNLINPGFSGQSPFLGIVTALLLPFALYSRKPGRRVVLPVIIVIFCLLTAPPGFAFLGHKPFSFIIARYWLNPLLMLFSLFAGFGVEEIKESISKPFNWRHISLVIFAALISLMPWLLYKLHVSLSTYSWDGGMDLMSASLSAARRDCKIIIAALIAIFGLRWLRIKPVWICIALICLSLVSEIAVARATLPKQPTFDYPVIDPIPWLQERRERIITLGRHFFLTNLSVAYGIADFHGFGAMDPPRYNKLSSFVHEAGDCTLNSAADLASVRYIVSRSPVVSVPEKQVQQISVIVPHRDKVIIKPGLTIIDGSILYQPENAQIIGHLTWNAKPDVSKDYSCQFVLLDTQGKELWSGDHYFVDSNSRNGNIVKQDFVLAVPLNVSSSSKISVCVRIIWAWSGANIWPDKCTLPQKGSMILLKNFIVQGQSHHFSKHHLKLALETPSQIRVYENLGALPASYIVHDVLYAKGENEAEQKIHSKVFNPYAQVVLEDASNISTGKAQSQLNPIERVTLARPNNNKVVLDANCADSGILVLTDTFYPGWNATVDGIATPIYRANMCFRAIPITKGKHHIEFEYRPLSFWIGVVLSGLCMIVISYFLARTNKSDDE